MEDYDSMVIQSCVLQTCPGFVGLVSSTTRYIFRQSGSQGEMVGSVGPMIGGRGHHPIFK